ncbi:MAG: DUF58 domain-containing protein [Propionibacteriaceae bacterium]|nr:DUF58 domain-containing protein [Propionibacteriaceae bacterium]
MFTLRGWLLLGGGIAWAIGCALAGYRTAAWVGLFLAFMAVLSWLTMLPSLRGGSAKRTVPSTVATAGEELSWRIDISVPGGNPGGIGQITEALPDSFGRSWRTAFGTALAPVVRSFEIRIRPLFRGDYQVGPGVVRFRHALSLAYTRRKIPGQETLHVLPRVHRLETFDVQAGRASVENPVPKVGSLGHDEVLLREYREGDDTRRIHWATSARVGELMVRREAQAWDQAAVVLLDNRAASYSKAAIDRRLELAVELAASLGCLLLSHGYGLNLIQADGKSDFYDGKGQESQLPLLFALKDVQRADTNTLTVPPLSVAQEFVVAVFGQLTRHDVVGLVEDFPGKGERIAVLVEGVDRDPQAEESLIDAGWQILSSEQLVGGME